MEKERTCCFTGNRMQKLPYGFNEQHLAYVWLKELLREEIEALITGQNVSHFISGMALA